MATNILSLPQLSASFTIATDADWRDQIQFLAPAGNVPLDISGIVFKSMLKAANGNILLTATTDDGTMVSGNTSGTLSWAIPRFPGTGSPASTSGLPPGAAQLDLLAYDSGAKIYVNLFTKAGPASVTIIQGITI